MQITTFVTDSLSPRIISSAVQIRDSVNFQFKIWNVRLYLVNSSTVVESSLLSHWLYKSDSRLQKKFAEQLIFVRFSFYLIRKVKRVCCMNFDPKLDYEMNRLKWQISMIIYQNLNVNNLNKRFRLCVCVCAPLPFIIDFIHKK